MKNEKLARALGESEWMHTLGDPERYYLHESLKFAEPILHEVCHAVTLGLRVAIDDDSKTPDRVSEFFEKANRLSTTMGLIHEVHAFAVEARVLRLLGWNRYMRLSALMENVRVTGYSGPALTHKTCKTLFRSFNRSQQTKDHASMAIRILCRIAKTQVDAAAVR